MQAKLLEAGGRNVSPYMFNAVFHSLGPMHHGKAISALKMDFTVDPRCILWFCSHFEVLKSRACISPCWLSWRRPREERGQHCSRHSRGHTERNQKKRDFAALIISDIYNHINGEENIQYKIHVAGFLKALNRTGWFKIVWALLFRKTAVIINNNTDRLLMERSTKGDGEGVSPAILLPISQDCSLWEWVKLHYSSIWLK